MLSVESKLAQEEFEPNSAPSLPERSELAFSSAAVHALDTSLDPTQMIKFKLAPSEQKVNVLKEEKKNHLLEKVCACDFVFLLFIAQEQQKTMALKDQVLNTPPLSKSTDELSEKAMAYTPDGMLPWSDRRSALTN